MRPDVDVRRADKCRNQFLKAAVLDQNGLCKKVVLLFAAKTFRGLIGADKQSFLSQS